VIDGSYCGAVVDSCEIVDVAYFGHSDSVVSTDFGKEKEREREELTPGILDSVACTAYLKLEHQARKEDTLLPIP
jgi:hypothetical protein